MSEFDAGFLSNVKSRSPATIIVGRATHGQLDLNQPDLLAEARRAVEAAAILNRHLSVHPLR